MNFSHERFDANKYVDEQLHMMDERVSQCNTRTNCSFNYLSNKRQLAVCCCSLSAIRAPSETSAFDA